MAEKRAAPTGAQVDAWLRAKSPARGFMQIPDPPDANSDSAKIDRLIRAYARGEDLEVEENDDEG